MVESIRQVPDWLNVSRGTLAKLEGLLDLVAKWNPKINLVSVTSLSEAWSRHLLDSAQLWAIAQAKSGKWLDIGSGGGFPGLVIGIMAEEAAPDLRVVLVESDKRKSVFLSEAVRQFKLNADVRCARIESLSPMGATIISARAFSPLQGLLPMVAQHLLPDGVALLPKGRRHQDELDQTGAQWTYCAEAIASKTDPSGVILKIWGLQNA